MEWSKTILGGILACVMTVGIYQFNVMDNIKLDDDRILPYGKNIEPAVISGDKNAVLREKIFDADTNKTSSVMRKLFSLQTSTPFTINLPDSTQNISLTGFISKKISENDQDNRKFAVGDYQNDRSKGKVLLDYGHIMPLNFTPTITDINSHEALFTFVAPFAVTTQGNGVFWYLGLFQIDYQTNILTHLNSAFIGDRAKIITIEPEEPFTPPYHVIVSYNDRKDAHSNHMPATKKTTLLLTVSKTSIDVNNAQIN